MSEFLSEAVINVRAVTDQFIKDVEKAIRQVEKQKAEIKLSVDPTGFRDALRTQVTKSSRGVLADIKLRVDPTGFRAALEAAVKTASRGVFAEVGVRAGDVTRGAATAAAGGQAAARASNRQTTEDLQAAALAADRFSRQRIQGIDEQQTRLERLARQEASLAAATKLGTAAVKEQNAEVQRLATNLATTATQARGVTQGAFDKEAARRAAREQTIATASREAEDAKQRQITDAFEQHERERAAFAERQRAIADRQAEAFFTKQIQREKSAAEIRKQITKAEVSGDVAEENKRQIAAAKDLERQQAAINSQRLKDARAVARVEAELERARAAGAVSGQAIAGARNREAEATRQLAIAERALVGQTRAATIAKGIEDAATRKNTLEKIANARATSEQIVAERTLALESVRAAAARTAANKSVRESILANSLSLLGLRGSALAANAAFLGTSAAIITTALAVKATADLESQFNLFAVTAGATADEMERVKAVAIDLGRDITLPGVGASDATAALVELTKAGLSVQDSIDGARGVLQLATAAGIDNAQATELAASALNAFGLAGDQAVRVADVLANSANASQGSITDVGIALQQSAAVARQAGLSLEQTVGALTLFARSGLRGSDAGTSLRTALIRLINPTAKAAGVIKELGLNVRTATGGIDLTVFQQFTEATRDLTAAQRDQALAIIFGQDAIRGAAILAREGTRGLNAQVTGLKQSGTAAEVAAARMKGLTGAAENLKNQLAALGLTIGKVLVPPLTLFTNVLATGVGIITDTLNSIDELALKFLKLGERMADIPQLKLGPIDTGDIDRFFVGLDKAIVNLFRGASFDATNADLKEVIGRMVEVRDESQKFQQSGGFIPPRLQNEAKDLTDRIIELGTAIQKTGNNNALNALLKNFASQVPAIQKAFRDGIITPAEKAELAATHLGAVFLRFVPKEAFKGLGAALRSNIEDANVRVEGAITNMGAHIRDGIESASRDAVRGMDRMGKDMGDALKNSLFASIQGLGGRLAGLEREALGIDIAGGPNEQQRLLENLENREAIARQELAKRIKAQSEGLTGFEPVREAQERLDSILDEQEQIRNQIASDAKQKASDIERAQKDADQAVLDALAPATRRLDTRAIVAEGTERLQDDIAVAKAQIKNNLRRIAVINKSFQDRQQAAKLIADLRDENIRLSQQIVTDTQGIFDAGRQAFEAKLGSAEAEDNINRQVSLIRGRIVAINKLIAAGKAEGKALQALKDERAERKRQLEELQDEQIQEQIALAQSIFDLTGNKNPLIKALNAAIAETRNDIAAAKKAGRSTVKLRTQLNQFLKQRKDMFEEAKEEAEKGTTAFDLLQGAAETFRATGGNIIGGNQPFAGPTGFTADLAQFLRRQQAAPFKVDTSDVPGRAIERQLVATNNLIAALDRNTDAQTGNTGANLGAPGTKYANITGARADAMGKYWQGIQARRVRESRGGI